MKNVFLTIVAIGIVLSTYAQDVSVFDKYEDYDEVTTVVVSKRAFKLLKKIGNDSEEKFKDMVEGLNGLKVFTTADPKVAAEMKVTFTKYRKSAKLEELIRVKDKDAHVKIYVKEGKDEDHVSEFLMLVDKIKTRSDGEEPKIVIISIVGDIDLNTISKITDQMDIEGKEHVRKAKK